MNGYRELKNKKFLISTIGILLVSVTLSSIIIIVEPQQNLASSVIFTILSCILLSVIFFLLVPTTNKRILEYLHQKRIHFFLIVSLLLFIPLFNLIFSPNILKAIFSYLLWYLLPTVLLIIPIIVTHDFMKRIAFIFHIFSVVVFAIGFDRRYTYDAINGFTELQYEFNALWISALILLLYSIQLDNFTEKFNWKVTSKKLLVALIGLIILFIIVVPIGFLTKFLVWSPVWPGIGMFFITFIGIWITIALPEETIARGVIQQQLTENIVKKESKMYPYWKWVAVVISSIVFGLTHWNNTSQEFVWIYILLASIAGIIYGVCWIYGGLFSAMLVHTMVDWIWALLLKAG